MTDLPVKFRRALDACTPVLFGTYYRTHVIIVYLSRDDHAFSERIPKMA